MDECRYFDTTDLINTLPKELSLFATQSLRFVSGPALNNLHTGQIHQKKNYPVCVQVSPLFFTDQFLLPYIQRHYIDQDDIGENEKNNGMIFQKFNWRLSLFLGTLDGIDTSLQPYIRESSKCWNVAVYPDEHAKFYFFDVTFTKITSRRHKCAPFRLYAQLTLESNGQTCELLAAGRSMVFDIFSHSQQYRYTLPDACVLCGSSKVISRPQAQLYKTVTSKHQNNVDELQLPSPLSMVLPQPKVTMIHPDYIHTNQSFVVFFDSCSPLNAHNDRLFSSWDGCDNVIELRRIYDIGNIFMGVLQHDYSYTSNRLIVRSVGEDVDKLVCCLYAQPNSCELRLAFK
jgi:hypothetical protein